MLFALRKHCTCSRCAAAQGSASGASAGWVAAQLAKLSQEPPVTTDVAWKAQVSAFQLSQGLKPDGLAGPTTFMQLNRALGVDEPHLRAAAAR